VALTVAGKGVSFMEGRVEWHYLPLNEEQYQRALGEVAA
jgi:transketolase